MKFRRKSIGSWGESGAAAAELAGLYAKSLSAPEAAPLSPHEPIDVHDGTLLNAVSNNSSSINPAIAAWMV